MRMRWLRRWVLSWGWVKDLEGEAHQRGWMAGRGALLMQTGWRRWDWERPPEGLRVVVRRVDWEEAEELEKGEGWPLTNIVGLYWRPAADGGERHE